MPSPANDVARVRRITRVVLPLAALLAAPAVAKAQGPVKPFQAMSASAASIRDSIVAFARAQLGRKYVRGGESPEKGFDCSGLVKYVMEAFHRDLPRTARLQAKEGTELTTDTSQLRPGDLLTFGKPKSGISHIGIYVGQGHFIHASSVAGRVVESLVNRRPSKLIKPWQGARRVLAADDSVLPAQAEKKPGTSGGGGGA